MNPTTRSADPLAVSGAEVRHLGAIGMRYALIVPPQWSGRVLVAVHGVARQWKSLTASFVNVCSEAGVALIAPRFSRRGYKGYQRLEAGSRGVPADLALDQVLEDAARCLGLREIPSVSLFGFSGGAQFAHRYTLREPQRVRGQVLAAAGYYTFPDMGVAFPYGLAHEGAARWKLEGFLTPTLVLVGDLDTERDDQLRAHKHVDRQQGRDRVARAQRWVLAVRAASARLGRLPDCRLELMHGCDHDFLRCTRQARLPHRTVHFLFSEDHGATGASP